MNSSLKKSTLMFPPQPSQQLGKQLVLRRQQNKYSLIQVHQTVTMFRDPNKWLPTQRD